MQINGLIQTFPIELKLLISAFIIVLSVGFYSGISFVNETSSISPAGLQEQYLGNESNEDARVMKFKKSDKELLSIVHSHILSMSVIFFLLGIILSTTNLNLTFKIFLMVEPFFSILLTFGGIYLLWKGVLWMKYFIIFSGSLMSISFTVSVTIILYQLFISKKVTN